MQLFISLDIPPLSSPIRYTDSVLLAGSCFTEHISDRLAQHKFRILGNPHGILFNPVSVADSLDSYMSGKIYREEDLFYLNELWNSWDHHTRFSDTDRQAVLGRINTSQEQAATVIKEADWIIITLGSAFQYYLKETGKPVANNHRAPAQWFEKRLLDTAYITERLTATVERLAHVNPKAQVLFTISPVRHIRDGVIDNNRSKARLIEAVHGLCGRFTSCHYFPAYELVIDVLRDYRFYDVDYVHPNYLATNYVWERFVQSCIDRQAEELMRQVRDIMTAKAHRARFVHTEAHRKFRREYAAKTAVLAERYPFLDLREELEFFTDK